MTQKQTLTLSPQFTTRPAQWDDLLAVVALNNAYTQAQIGTDSSSEADIRALWQAPNFKLENNTHVVLNPEGRLVGCMTVWDVGTPPVNIWTWGCTHPDYEGQGIGTYLISWAEERCQHAVSRCPDGARVIMGVATIQNHASSNHLFQAYGMIPYRNFHKMTIQFEGKAPPVPKFPPHIKVRTYQHPDDLEAVAFAVDESFKDHFGHVAQPVAEQEKRMRHWVEGVEDHDSSLWFLAMDGEEIAGISLCDPKANDNPNHGHVDTLGVRRRWRKQGIGLALLHHTFAEFHRRGQQGVNLDVDASSLTGATRLYENAGMFVRHIEVAYEKEIRAGHDLSTRTIDE